MAKWAARRIDSNSIAVLTCTCIETAVARKHQCIQVLCSFPTALSARTAELYVESRNPHAGLWHAQLPESQVLLGYNGHCHNCLVHAGANDGLQDLSGPRKRPQRVLLLHARLSPLATGLSIAYDTTCGQAIL